jgi:hypothetical protein
MSNQEIASKEVEVMTTEEVEEAKEEIKTCDICAESFNKRRQNIKCQFCDFAACTACYKVYLLTINKPGCMSQECKGEWSRAFIHKNFPGSYVTTELRDHLKEVLYQSHVALMPETQIHIEAQNYRDDIRIEIFKLVHTNNDIAIKARKREECRLKSWNSDTHYKLGQLREEMENKWSTRIQMINEEAQKMPRRLDLQVRKNVDEFLASNEEYNSNRAKLQELYAELGGGGTAEKKERAKFIRKCGDGDCRGFLSTRWKCGLCEKSTCAECHEFLGTNKVGGTNEVEEHICNPDNVATAKLLATDTKPCPGCQNGIFKIDGCDQMWCTQCKTGFSWKTGKIEMKLHNPHYYEWQRQNGGLARAPGDVECGRVLDHFLAGEINQRITKLMNDNTFDPQNKTKEEVEEAHETIHQLGRVIHTTGTIIRNCVHLMAYDRDEVDVQNETLQLRVRYLVKNLDDKEFKQKLMMLETKYAKEHEIRTIYQLLTTTITDIMFRFKDTISENINLGILDEVDAIVEYVNHCLLDTGKVFKMASIIQFEPNLNMLKLML